VVALVGLVNSAVVVALADFADQNEIPLVVTVGSASEVTMPENASPWVNRVSVASGQEERPLGWYAATQLGYENSAVVVWDFLSGNERGAAFSEVFEGAGGQVINEQKPPPNATEYGPFLAAIDPDTTQSVYVFAAGPGSVAFFQQYQDFGLGDITPMGSGFLTAGILEELGETALGLIQTGQYSPLIDTPNNRAFVDAYTQATGDEAGVYSSQGYIGAQTLALALEALDGDTSDPAAIAAAIRALEFDSLAGKISFNEYGQVIRDIYVTRVVESGDGVTQDIIDVIEQVDQFWTP
jgi:branched-chain amino acid transport system substrate-binding protein